MIYLSNKHNENENKIFIFEKRSCKFPFMGIFFCTIHCSIYFDILVKFSYYVSLLLGEDLHSSSSSSGAATTELSLPLVRKLFYSQFN
jgi:hypothetical protein